VSQWDESWSILELHMDGTRIEPNPILSKLGHIIFSRLLMLFSSIANQIVFAGESIPVRLFLTPYELTPTYRNINNKFSVKYYLNLVLVDEEDRRYFKQQEITMYRLLESAPSS